MESLRMVPALMFCTADDMISGDEGDTAAQTANPFYRNAAIPCAWCSNDEQVEATN